MSYEISDLHHTLKLTLNTDATNTLTLKTYINGSSSSHSPSYTPTSTSDGLVFSIPHSDFTIGDTITKFELVSSNNTPPYQTNEGVVVLLNGEEIPVGKVTTSGGVDTLVRDEDDNIVTEDRLSNNKFYLNFEKEGSYDIQAVYLGNGSYAVGKTDKVHFEVKQPPLDESGSASNDGAYLLKFVNSTTPAMTYNDQTKVYFRLTKGGVPIKNRTIQKVKPNGAVETSSTSSKGLVYAINNNWNAGKWKIGARYFDETTQKVITSTYRTITIKKGTPTFTDNYSSPGTFVKGSKYKVALKYRGTAMAKTKLILYVNGKKTTKTTSSNGVITYPFKSKGTFNIKVVFAGDKNHNKVELKRKFTISE